MPSTKRPRSPTPPSPPPALPEEEKKEDIHTSSPLTDRSSTFLAHFSFSLPARTLQSHPSISTATHRILAWRKPSPQRPLSASSPKIFTTGFDDDGERYAGKRLVRVLEDMGVEEGAVVCARWYGGVLLGPVRFSHIERCAREAVGRGMAGREAKRRRMGEKEEEEEEERGRLVEELRERDRSVLVLRGLLAEKREKGRGEEKGTGNRNGASQHASVADATSPSKREVDYGKMSLEVLRKMDKARDKTIAWLLKEIDQAEIEHGVAELDDALLRQEESQQKSDTTRVGQENG